MVVPDNLSQITDCCGAAIGYDSNVERFECASCGNEVEFTLEPIFILLENLSFLGLSVDEIKSTNPIFKPEVKLVIEMTDGEKFYLFAKKKVCECE